MLPVENMNNTKKDDVRQLMGQALDGLDQKIAGEMEYDGFEQDRYIVEKTLFAVAELRKAHDRAWRVISDIALASIPVVEDDV